MSNFKRILSLALTMLMVIGCFATVSAFNDVTEYEDEIDALYDLGIIEGKDAEGTTYAPDEDVTRWQMALLIAKMMTGKVDNAYVNWYSTENFTPFTDVNADQFYGSMSYAHNKGVIRGTTDTTFNPNGKITYQDALTMLVRALGYGSAEMDEGYPWTFIDMAIKLGVDEGMPTELNYGDALTRGEVAKLLYNTLYAQRYNDPYEWDYEDDYTCFAYDVFDYFASDVTVMIVAAEGYKLDDAMASFFNVWGEDSYGATVRSSLDYTEYNKLIPAKLGSYVGFAITYADPDSEYYDMIGKVFVLPASEFGLEKASRLDLGRSFGVVFSDWYEGSSASGVREFDKCKAFARDTYSKGEFAMANVSSTDATLNTVTIDGTTYYAVEKLSKHLTNGDRNTAYNNDELLVIGAKNGVRLRSAASNVYENLVAYDLNGDGIYDVAYYLDYIQAKATTVPSNISYVTFGKTVGSLTAETYYTDLYPDYGQLAGLGIPVTYFCGLDGKPEYPVQGGFYRYSSIDRLDQVVIEPVTTTTVTGVVTGVDLFKKSITLDSVDENAPGKVYNKVGVAGLDYCQIENLVYNGDFGFGTDLLGKRVTLVMDDTGAVVAINDAPLPGAPAEGFGIYVFIRDTGRDVKVGDKTYDIIAVYDNNADIQYITVQAVRPSGNQTTLASIYEGQNIRLYDMGNGYYEIMACDGPDFGHYWSFNSSTKINEFGFMDYSGTWAGDGGARNYYFDFSEAKVLIYTGSTFVEYDGSELGVGTWFQNPYARLVLTDKKDGSFKVDFAYFWGFNGDLSYNVSTVAATSKAVSSIVYIGNNADAYAWINYDNVGGHVAGNYEVTYFKALDMLTGEVRAVTFEGDMNERAPEGFYYVDKNNELRQAYNTIAGKYELVSANDQISFAEGPVKLTKYEVNLGQVTRYGLNVKYLYASDFRTDVADLGAFCYANNIWQPANFQPNKSAVYAGNVYSSDTVIVVIGHGLEAEPHDINWVSNNNGTHSRSCACGSFTEACTYDWDTCTECGYVDGNYHIYTAAELKEFRDAVNAGDDFSGKTVVLEADINLNNENWTPIAANVNGTQYFFQGTFDGQEYTISSLNIENVKVEAGLFGYLGVATVKNINITNVKITGNHSAGAIAGTAGYGAVIENCNVKNVNITLTPDYDDSYTTSTKYDNGDDAGAIVGVLNGYAHGITSVLDCTAENVTIKGYRDLGGIAGTANANGSEIKVTNCTVTGLSITVDQTTGYYGDKPANANGEVVGRLIGNVDTTGSTASATTKIQINMMNYGAIGANADFRVAAYSDAALTTQAYGVTQLHYVVTPQDLSDLFWAYVGAGYGATPVYLADYGCVFTITNAKIYNGKPGDADYGTTVSTNLSDYNGAALGLVLDGAANAHALTSFALLGFGAKPANATLTAGTYTIEIPVSADGNSVWYFTTHLDQTNYSDHF